MGHGSSESNTAPVVMYSTSWCGYCHRLKSQLEREGIEYSVVDIEQDPAAAEFVMGVNGGNQTVPTVRFADGTTLDAGVIIWATGYGPDYSWIGIPGLIRDGKVIHRRGATEVPGLYVLGLSWQHTRGSALLGFVQDDAAYLTGLITHTSRATQAAAASPAAQQTA